MSCFALSILLFFVAYSASASLFAILNLILALSISITRVSQDHMQLYLQLGSCLLLTTYAIKLYL